MYEPTHDEQPAPALAPTSDDDTSGYLIIVVCRQSVPVGPEIVDPNVRSLVNPSIRGLIDPNVRNLSLNT